MKKLILIQFVLLFFMNVTFAQKVVFEEQFKANNYPVGFNFLPNLNSLVVQKGEFIEGNSNKVIKNINSYDSEGCIEILLKNERASSCLFSPIENTYKINFNASNTENTNKYKIVSDGKAFFFDTNSKEYQFFNDQYQVNIFNQKNTDAIDITKDQIFLNVTNIQTRVIEKIAITKPDLNRIDNNLTAKYANGIDFNFRVNEYNIGLITKSIAKNYHSTSLFRTIYAYNGQKTNDYEYKIDLKDKNLMYCNNGGGSVYSNPQTGDTFLSDLTINNFVTDPKTEDVYVYGLFGKNAKNATNITNEPLGFYVFKFDKSGNKTWELIKEISDIEDFNTNQNITNLTLDCVVRANNLLVSIHSSGTKKQYLQYSFINNEDGKTEESNKIKYMISKDSNNKNKQLLIDSKFTLNNDKKSLDVNSLIANSSNLDFSNYIKSTQNITKLYFKTFFGKKGIWLFETDNDGNYRILYFKD
jgi:hypothetical protein